MSLYKQFKTDADKEQNGIIISYAANDDGTVPSFRLLRRCSSNQRYAKALATEIAPYRRLLDLGTLDNRTSDKIFMRVFCRSVLIGWDNVRDEANQPIPFNLENALMLFEQLPDLYDDLVAQSSKASLFLASVNEADAKNS